ncbi:glycosyltransferase [Nonomuraea sp. NPDC004186]
MRIVRLANFVTPTSGGLRTALHELGAGYAAAGHEPVLVVPGAAARDERTPAGRVVTLPGPVVPGLGGYRVIAARGTLRRLLEELAPDRIEVSDRTTLRWLGPWARAAGVRSVMVSHESLSALLRLYGPLGRLADPVNRATAARFDTVVCTTAWAAAEFARLGVPNLVRVPLGVDLATFSPERFDPGLRSRLAARGEALLVHCGRLSPEKRPDRSIRALAELRRRGVPAVLVVAGDGPLRPRPAAPRSWPRATAPCPRSSARRGRRWPTIRRPTPARSRSCCPTPRAGSGPGPGPSGTAGPPRSGASWTRTA